jgi:hypothetical protein
MNKFTTHIYCEIEKAIHYHKYRQLRRAAEIYRWLTIN